MRVLLTGMSGSGKSTLTAALVERGYRAVDLDGPEWSEYRVLREDEVPPGVPAGRDWVWRDEHVAALLRTALEGTLFLSGCAPTQGRFRAQFDRVVLLTAPVEVTLARLAGRTTNPFGKQPEEREKILADKAAFEPMLRASADHVIDTAEPIETTIERLLDLVTP